MKIYLAARLSRQTEMIGYARCLEALGYAVTSRWILGNHEGESPADPLNAQLAAEDRQDILNSDIVISFTEDQAFPRGSRHVEFGIGYEHGKLMYFVGPYENIFHWLKGVLWFDSWETIFEHLEEVMTFHTAQEYMQQVSTGLFPAAYEASMATSSSRLDLFTVNSL